VVVPCLRGVWGWMGSFSVSDISHRHGDELSLLSARFLVYFSSCTAPSEQNYPVYSCWLDLSTAVLWSRDRVSKRECTRVHLDKVLVTRPCHQGLILGLDTLSPRFRFWDLLPRSWTWSWDHNAKVSALRPWC